MQLHFLIVLVPLAAGQLILGPCPRPPPHVQNLDMKKYSGEWYVVAQSRRHPMTASDCQRVTYTERNRTLSGNFTYIDSDSNHKISKQGILKTDFRPPAGNMYLRFEDLPRNYQFRVLKTDYSNVAVEYICLYGAFNYTASVTVLHRRPPTNATDLNTALQRFNLTSVVAPHFRKDMKIINHARC